ncbi:MAG: hypothetical protein GY777_01495 [Candidatus Brocadiaceae bacterium]|nr:hypothetical protein [Candidatus Brocadiaceae bacterium]
MRILALTGNQLRHKYYVNYLSKHHDLVAVFAEDRFDKDAYGSEYSVLREHFNRRTDTENKYFSGYDWPKSSRIIEVPRNGMSSADIEEEIRNINPEGIAVLGCGVIKDNIIKLCPNFVNAHQGLSPYYKGAGTNLWPFYNEEPEYVGVTVHYIDPGVDTGRIICHGRPEIKIGDTLHDIGCKTIVVSAEIVSKVFRVLEKRPIEGIDQWDEGREYKRKDFNYEVVQHVNSLFKNGLIEKYICRKKKGNANVRLIVIES